MEKLEAPEYAMVAFLPENFLHKSVNEPFIQEIMSHGDDIEVLTPIWLRNLLKEKSDSLAALYK